METDLFEQRWIEVKGVIRFYWDKLSDEDLERCGGDEESLVELIMDKYGEERSQIEETLGPILAKLSHPHLSKYENPNRDVSAI
jgi:S-methylmethionine-dependent homocysteine/selenocysteine methylase